MTPQTGILENAPAASSTSPNIYNQVSSMGMKNDETANPSQEQPQMESLTEKATKRFGAVFQQFVDLTESYPGSEKESQIVKDSLANWFRAISQKINESSGENSTY